MTNYDVLIIGAGLSGIGMACHLKMTVPGITFAIIERRRRMGGTWTSSSIQD
ncbi:NAD(P)-binding protein [Sinorhizobium americanum]|uniref:NAD(P)-binding protein n=1 Tax=Sinorhizobium americanum TaxID=194963 RepID=UPI000A887441|nr:NAD(P)-binding protein [Sinorhizobium americanum]